MDPTLWECLGIFVALVLACLYIDWRIEKKKNRERQLAENKKSIERALAEEAGRSASASSSRQFYSGRVPSGKGRSEDSSVYRATPRATPAAVDEEDSMAANSFAIGSILSSSPAADDSPVFQGFSSGDSGGAGASDSWSDSSSSDSSSSCDSGSSGDSGSCDSGSSGSDS